VIPADTSVLTDSLGRYSIPVPAGRAYRLTIRAIPYGPAELIVEVTAPGELQRDFALDSASRRAAVELDPVTVKAAAPVDYRLVDFERRRKTGRGQYLNDEQIRRSGAASLQDLTRGMRGVLQNCGGANGCRIEMARAPMHCLPRYIVDNQVDNVFGPTTPIRDIVGVEVYSGPSDVPGEYAGSNAMCGVIVLWTRSGPTPRLKP
jgi:hypothetical protein